MSSSEKWRIVHSSHEASTARIIAEFKQAYIAASEPLGMALFSFLDNALCLTPDSVPYCDSLLARWPWNELNEPPSVGYRWLAGDESLKAT